MKGGETCILNWHRNSRLQSRASVAGGDSVGLVGKVYFRRTLKAMNALAFMQTAGFRRMLSRYVYPAAQVEAKRPGPALGQSSPPFVCSTCLPRWYATNADVSQQTKSHAPSPLILKSASMTHVEGILRYKFKDRSVLAQAMAHRSVVNSGLSHRPVMYEEEDGRLGEIETNNERLELLGDRVFGLLVVEALYHHDVAGSEGELSVMAHSLLSRDQAHEFCEYVYQHHRVTPLTVANMHTRSLN